MLGQKFRSPFLAGLLVFAMLPWFSGCSRLRRAQNADVVYVVARQTFLRDRVAAVSNRVAPVVNGQRLTVLERGRRFLRVKTEKNEIGWIEERAVIGPEVYQGFLDLAKEHAADQVVASATLRDDLYMHLKPGRDTERYYLLPENEKLQLLVRASVPKPQPSWGVLPKPVATPPPAKGKSGAGKAADGKAGPEAGKSEAPAPPPMEDWWLVRDAKGRAGWLLARRLDVDIPDAIAGYAEGQKIVGAYVLTTIRDEESALPDKQVPIYVTVLNAWKDGLPYDFDQVRVFTWNVKKHRYETAFRQRGIEGYLPVQVSQENLDGSGPVPVFAFKAKLAGEEAAPAAPATAGQAQSGQTVGGQPPMQTVRYRLDGVMVKRVLAPGEAPPRLTVKKPAAKAGKLGRRRKR